jgi:hypothetical protein
LQADIQADLQTSMARALMLYLLAIVGGSGMSLSSDGVQVCFRVAALLNELAVREGGMRQLILAWLTQAGYADAAKQDLARPDGRRRQSPPRAAQELAGSL